MPQEKRYHVQAVIGVAIAVVGALIGLDAIFNGFFGFDWLSMGFDKKHDTLLAMAFVLLGLWLYIRAMETLEKLDEQEEELEARGL